MEGIWLTWERQRRNIGISSALGWEYYEINYDGIEKFRIYRYILSIYDTIRILIKRKPEVVVAQNPSIVLAFLVLLFKKILNYKAIIDSHNSGIFPFEGRSRFLMIVSGILQRYADLTLVTNESLKTIVESNKGKAFILPDMIPDVPKTRRFPFLGKINIAFICTYSEDEPYIEVLKAGSLLSDDIFIYFTGKYEGKININSIPKNIRLLGFISEKEYWSLLASADVIMDLTLREDCLVCGAYEGIGLSKPLILSNTEALKSYFNKGCVYVEPDAVSIASGIIEAIDNKERLMKDIKNLKESMNNEWNNDLQLFLKII